MWRCCGVQPPYSPHAAALAPRRRAPPTFAPDASPPTSPPRLLATAPQATTVLDSRPRRHAAAPWPKSPPPFTSLRPAALPVQLPPSTRVSPLRACLVRSLSAGDGSAGWVSAVGALGDGSGVFSVYVRGGVRAGAHVLYLDQTETRERKACKVRPHVRYPTRPNAKRLGGYHPPQNRPERRVPRPSAYLSADRSSLINAA